MRERSFGKRHPTSVFRLAILLAAGGALAPPLHAGVFDVSRTREIELGREAAAVFERSVRPSHDATLVARLERIGRRLVRVADRPDLPYEFHVVETDDINAVAFPGGFVYAFAGLMEALPSDDALAFVVAHEIAHAAKRHWARRYEKAVTLSVLTLGYGDILQLFLQPHYSRRYESEADHYGMLWATKAGFAPEGSVQAMGTLKELARSNPGLSIFRSHPLTDQRTKRLTSQIEVVKTEMAVQRASDTQAQPTAEPAAPLEPLSATVPEGLAGYDLAPNARFPLRLGARWVYRSTTGEADAVRRTVSVISGVPGADSAFRIETSYGHDVRASSLVATTGNAVLMRPQARGSKGAWRTEWVTGLSAGESVGAGEFEFVGGGSEEVTVPLGTFTAVRIEKRRPGSASPTAIAWFVEGIGLVKLHIPADNLTELLESYTPGETPPPPPKPKQEPVEKSG